MSNESRLKEWAQFKPFMWSLPGTEDPLKEAEVQRAVLGYLLRALSRGRVPLYQPLMDYLEGRTPLPSCGFIGCLMDQQCGDHVH